MGEIARKFIALVAFVACAQLLVSPAALAAGLGQLNVLSSLGEPLKAEIELLSVQPSEAESLVARLASNQAYRQANIELNGALLSVKFAIENRAPGQYVISLTSVQPMNEPFIDMLVELTWNAGRLVREYTFLLDPPQYKGGMTASVPAVEPPTVQASPVSPPPAAPTAQPLAPVEPAAPVRQAAKPAAPATPAAEPRSTGSYEVKRGDTLAKIAQQNRIEGVSLQQMLVALYKNNPDAFDGENMNRLRAGRILNLPDRDTAAAATQGEAQRLVNAQSADYARYRSSLGAAVASAPARPDAGRQASGRVGAPAPDKAAAAKEAPKDQLRLSRPEDAKAGTKAAATAASDDAAAREKALKEANERIALLEKNIAAMKSQAGAQLQAQAAKGAPPAKPEAAKPEPAKAPAPAPKAEPAKPEAAKPEPAKPEAAKPEAAKPEAAKAADAAAAPAGDAAKAPEAAPAPKPKPKPVPPPPPPPEASFTDQLLDDPMTLYGGGAVILLLFGYAIYAVRKKRKQAAAAASSNIVGMAEPSFSGSMLASPGDSEEAAPVAAETSSGAAAPAMAAAMAAPAAESDEIDPVAEADVYMAYGRDAQAEEILKEALAKEPGRQAVQLKLLEIYANRKDGASFEAVAKDVHAATGGQGAEWEKVALLGLSIDSGNPLYGGVIREVPAAGAEDTVVMQAMDVNAPAPDLVLDAGPADAAPAVDFDLDAPAPAAEAPAPEAPAAESAPATLDFDLDLGGDKPAEATPAAPAEAPAVDAGMSIDFELPSMDAAPAEAPAAPAPAAEAPSDGGLSIDFDLGTPAAPPAEPEAAPALDLSGISLDLGTPDAGAAAPDAQWQEVATKLDLAKAYQDMGDKDGARELLNEVLKEGDAAQQEQARTMMEALG